MRFESISAKKPEKFLSLRVGVELGDYEEDLAHVMRHHRIGQPGNYIITPLASPRSIYYGCEADTHEDLQTHLNLLPDLVLPPQVWELHVAVSIGHLPLYAANNEKALRTFDQLFRHAMYLPTPVVVIECPKTRATQARVAEIINEQLENCPGEKLILFKLSLGSGTCTSPIESSNASLNSDQNGPRLDPRCDVEMGTTESLRDEENCSSGISTCSLSDNSQTSNDARLQDVLLTDWACWDRFRRYLKPDHRIGVCLAIDDDLGMNIDHLDRWTGEPVRMITLSVDRFSSRRGFAHTMQPSGGIREFLRMIALSNSFLTSFVVQAKHDYDIQEHLKSLSNLCDFIDQDHIDFLRAWNDIPMNPLQPLSTNLDSSTYQVFERDTAKYTQYHQAMLEALDHLLMRDSSKNRTKFIIMVLGAGRGPLVDAMIQAIHKLRLRNIQFKIYALDKNKSSIVSLNYKKRRYWDQFIQNIETEIVEADMRVWEPAVKADIIATELLGSFSDNELSPECIDGTWRFATPETISIPESYKSYLAPICSYRMHQEMYKAKRFFTDKANIYDQIQVVRLSNYYTISEPQELFYFDHKDISMKPSFERTNQREATLEFRTKIETTCHGFAGYFGAQLFGQSTISTVPEYKTPTMESWFPAFIPIEKPIHLQANEKIVIKFFRKESDVKVWYEWIILHPERSRIHSKDGLGTAMSKII